MMTRCHKMKFTTKQLQFGDFHTSDVTLLQHTIVGDAIAQGGDDISVGHPSDLVTRLAETLEVLAQRLIRVLLSLGS